MRAPMARRTGHVHQSTAAQMPCYSQAFRQSSISLAMQLRIAVGGYLRLNHQCYQALYLRSIYRLPWPQQAR